MSTVGDALAARKNVVLMQERMSVMQKDVGVLTGLVDGLNDYVVAVDKRVIRIETMIEMSRTGEIAISRGRGET